MESLTEKIIHILAEGPATPDDVSRRLGIAWSTAHGNMLRLVGEGKIALSRKGKVNVFYLKGKPQLAFKTPPWIKPKELEEVSKELEEYLSDMPKASEMVSRERRRL